MKPARELFKRLWLHMAEFAVDHPQSFVFLELHHHAAYLDAESRALEQRMLHLFSGVIVSAQVRGELKAGDPKLMMGMVMGAFIGVIRGCMEWNTKLEDANWLFAERAGVGAGTIYRYFESKEALVNALYRAEKMKFAQNVVERVNAAGPGREPARELFRRLWMHMADFAVAHPESFVFLELHHHAAYLDAESRALEQRMLQLFGAVIVAAQARGELKAGDPKLMMGMVMGGFIGVIRSCMENATPLAKADWAFAERCMWEAIRA